MVRQGISNDEKTVGASQSKPKPIQTAEPSKGTTSNMDKNESVGVPLIRKSLERHDLSSSAQEILMASWRSGTLNRWKSYCQKHNVDLFNPDLKYPIKFFVSLHKTGFGYSATNTARSDINLENTF